MKYKQVQDLEWQMPILEGYKMACCDCGLVHTMNFKIVKEGKEIKGARVLMQATRNERSTAQVRRHKNKPNDKGK